MITSLLAVTFLLILVKKAHFHDPAILLSPNFETVLEV